MASSWRSRATPRRSTPAKYPEYAGGGEAWCGPTATTMVAEFWGRGPSADDLSVVDPRFFDRQVDHAARYTYDHAYRGTGNWPFNAAYAARFGLRAAVTRLRRRRGIRRTGEWPEGLSFGSRAGERGAVREGSYTASSSDRSAAAPPTEMGKRPRLLGRALAAVAAARGALAASLRRLHPDVVAGVRPSPVPTPEPESFASSLSRVAHLSTVAIVNSLASHPDAAEEAYYAALSAGAGRPDPGSVMRLHCAAAELRAARGDLPAAREALAAAERAVGELPRSEVPNAYLLIARGSVLELQGAVGEAHEAYRAAAVEAEAAGAQYASIKATILAARLSPDPAEADPALHRALRAVVQQGYRDFLVARPAVAEWLRERAASADLSLGELAALELLLAAPAEIAASPLAEPAAAPRAALGVLLLGPFAIRRGAAELGREAWRTAKAKELFALLALQRDRVVAREVLIESLWPGADPASGVSRFHFTLHALRRAIAALGLADAITVTHEGPGYRLTLPADAELDHEAFTAALRKVRETGRAGGGEAAHPLLRAALGLYRDRFLADLSGAWLEERREELERQFVSAARELAEAELGAGDPTAAIHWGQAVTAREPYDEATHRLLMRAYAERGDDGLAARHYHALEKLLGAELGEQPQPATRELYQQLRAGRSAAMASHPAAKPA